METIWVTSQECLKLRATERLFRLHISDPSNEESDDLFAIDRTMLSISSDASVCVSVTFVPCQIFRYHALLAIPSLDLPDDPACCEKQEE